WKSAKNIRKTSSTKRPSYLPRRQTGGIFATLSSAGLTANGRLRISKKATSRLPAAFWQTCQWSLAAACAGTARPAKLSGMMKPIAGWRERIGHRGNTRFRKVFEAARVSEAKRLRRTRHTPLAPAIAEPRTAGQKGGHSDSERPVDALTSSCGSDCV